MKTYCNESEHPIAEQFIQALPESASNRLVVDGLSYMRNYARTVPRLSDEQHHTLFGQIAANTSLPETETAVTQVAESYLGLTIDIAHTRWVRNRDVGLDTLVSAACEGLVETIYLYATRRYHRSFPAYLRPALDNIMTNEIMFERYGVTNGWHRSELKRYRKAYSELAGATENITVEAVAEHAGLSTGKALTVYRRGTGLGVGKMIPEKEEAGPMGNPDYLTEEQKQKQILVERGLSLLSHVNAKIISKYFEIGGAKYGAEELATIYGVSSRNIYTTVYRAKQMLAEIIPQLQDGTFDYAAWRIKYQTCKNPLILLDILREAVPPEASQVDVRRLADYELEELGESPEVTSIIRHLYGLSDGVPKTGQEVAAITSLSIHKVYRIEREFLRRQNVIVKSKR